MTTIAKKRLNRFIKESESPTRVKRFVEQVEQMIDEYNRGNEPLDALIKRVALLFHEHEQEGLPFIDILFITGTKIRDFQKYGPRELEFRVEKNFEDPVMLLKRDIWLSSFEKRWEAKQKAYDAKMKKKKKSPSVSKKKKSPEKINVLQPRRKVVPTKTGPTNGILPARVISGEAIPALSVLKALDVSDRVAVAKVLKSRPSPRPSASRRRSPRPSASRRRSLRPSASRRRSPGGCPVGCIKDPRKPCPPGYERAPSGHCRKRKH